MNLQPFSQLTTDLERELIRLHYTKPTIRFYRRMWAKIALFLEAEHSDFFTEELGLRFLETRYNFLEREKNGRLTQGLVNIGRVVRMLGDFQQHRCILRRHYKHRELLQTDTFRCILASYVTDCQQRQYSRSTQDHYRKGAEKFLSFLESRGVTDCTQITAEHCESYILTWLGYQAKTVELQCCALRSFLRYLRASEQHAENLADTIPTITVHKHARIPSAWTAEQVNQVLNAIDRGNPTGKRDYAMILLVARLGLRTMDVKHLQIADLHWSEHRIEFVASKTGQVLSLPLLPDVGWAIIDYLKHGRPRVNSPHLFLRHLAPLEPFADDDHLHQLLEKYRKLAHVSLPANKKRGMHALRHTLASVLLEQQTPLAVISDILGHANTDSTAVYLKIDVERLRECALDLEKELRQ
jgi:site-specific recombinase XerD